MDPVTTTTQTYHPEDQFIFDIYIDAQLKIEIKELVADVFRSVLPNSGDENLILEDVGM